MKEDLHYTYSYEWFVGKTNVHAADRKEKISFESRQSFIYFVLFVYQEQSLVEKFRSQGGQSL